MRGTRGGLAAASLTVVGALAGCGQIIGLGGLHDRTGDAGSGLGDPDGNAGDGDGGESPLDGTAATDARTDAPGPKNDAEVGGDAGAPDSEVGSACTPFTQRCSGTGIQTCAANGAWGAPVTCATGMCVGSACAGVTTSGASCQSGGGGTNDCGPSGTESCCTSLEVTGGTFYRTYDPATPDGGIALAPDGGPAELADPAVVSGFRLDKYLVTVGRFRVFRDLVFPPDGPPDGGAPGSWMPKDGAGIHAHLNGGRGLAVANGTYETGWSHVDDGYITPTDLNLGCSEPYATWTTTPTAASEVRPINCVNSYEAYVFCIWDGGFLPTEAEYEYAAAGGSQEREYPWGSAAPSLTYAIFFSDYPAQGGCTGSNCLAPVGTPTAGAGLWGQLDLAGGVYEWNLDFYGSPYPSPCVDCLATPVGGTSPRVGRGGSFVAGPSYLRPPTRGYQPANNRNDEVGFRCARVP